MCNLFAVRSSAEEVAAHFGVRGPAAIEMPGETLPRSPALIVREAGGRRVLTSLPWGFPRLTNETRSKAQGPTPVNLIANLTSPMWQKLVHEPRYRCLIPLTHFAEPDGYPGAKTRTWFRVKDAPIFAWAGFCRNTPDWGPVFGGMTTDSNRLVAPLNPRMPVLLRPDDYDRWLHGDVGDVIDFQFRTIPSEHLLLEKTPDLWVRRELMPESQMALSL